MGRSDFQANIEAALRRSERTGTGVSPFWLDETVLAGMAEAGLETLPADLGFTLGSAVARFRRIAREVAEANGHADPEQSAQAAAALLAMVEILKALPPTS